MGTERPTGMFENAWNIIREPSNNNSQVALAIAVIVVSASAGLLCAFLYGLAARTDGIANRLTGGLVALLACAGAFSAGGMLGLLFGSPSWGSAVVRNKNASGEREPEAAASSSSIRPNTSLERIADWLTTMIVGLSLVHLKTIEERSTTLAVWLTRAIAGDEHTANGTGGIVIALAFSFAGFLLVYLWAMRFLPSELRSSYTDLAMRIDTIEEKSNQLLNEFKKQPYFSVPKYALEGIERKLEREGVDADTRANIRTRYSTAMTADDEPMRDFGPSVKGGYQLSAKVTQAGPGQYQIEAYLELPSDAKAQKIFWLLHNTYAPDVASECPVDEGHASYTTTASEAYWIGAVVPVEGEQSINLALDLRDAQGATAEFKGLPAELS